MAQPRYPKSLPERKTVRSALLRFSEISSEASNAAARGPQLIRQDPPEVNPKKRAVSILNRYSPRGNTQRVG
jgi:hypothetical protein